jgi:hypothetical protein
MQKSGLKKEIKSESQEPNQNSAVFFVEPIKETQKNCPEKKNSSKKKK